LTKECQRLSIDVYFVFTMVKKNIKDKIEELLKAKRKVKERLKKIDQFFQEEKENEEAWPGHATNRYQLAESDRQVLLNNLSLIEEELRNLGYKEK